MSVSALAMAGILERSRAIDAAQGILNTFLAGVMSSHGHENVQVTGVDAEALTVAFVPVKAAR